MQQKATLPIKRDEPKICACGSSSSNNHTTCTNITKYYLDFNEKCTMTKLNNMASLFCANCWRLKPNIDFVISYFTFNKVVLTSNICSSILANMDVTTLDTIIKLQLELFNHDIKQELLFECNKLLYNSTPENFIKYVYEKNDFVVSSKHLQKLVDLNKNRYEYFVRQLVIKNLAVLSTFPSVVELFSFITLSGNDERVILEIFDKCKTHADAQIKYEGLLKLFIEKCSLDQIRFLLMKIKFNVTNNIFKNGIINGKESSYNANLMDLLISFNIGIEVNKELVINLLKRNQYINNISKYGIVINNEIMEIAAENDVFMYTTNDIPSEKYLSIMCSKARYYKGEKELLKELERLRQIGGIYTKKCMKSACLIGSHAIINFLIDSCNLKLDDECVAPLCLYEETKIFAKIVKNYSKTNLDLEVSPPDNKKQIFINDELITRVNCREINGKKMEINENEKYNIYNQIKELLNIKQEQITFQELYFTTLKFLINNKYVIGQYFFISGRLSKILKIDEGTICQIDDLKNVTQYFIKTTYSLS